MVTTEIIVENNSKINLLGLQKMNFEKDDSTSDNTGGTSKTVWVGYPRMRMTR